MLGPRFLAASSCSAVTWYISGDCIIVLPCTTLLTGGGATGESPSKPSGGISVPTCGTAGISVGDSDASKISLILSPRLGETFAGDTLASGKPASNLLGETCWGEYCATKSSSI